MPPRRAECYFALKAWNAQRAGAAAVLIADSVDEQLLTMDSPEASPGTEYIDKINIPSALVNRAFGESLKKMTRTVAGDGEGWTTGQRRGPAKAAGALSSPSGAACRTLFARFAASRMRHVPHSWAWRHSMCLGRRRGTAPV